MEKKKSSLYDGTTLVGGGLVHSFASIFHKKEESVNGSKLIASALILITWLPIAILAFIWDSVAEVDEISFFEDFYMHVKFVLVLPFLIIIEKMVNSTFIQYIENTRQLIIKSDQEKFDELVKQLHRLTRTRIVELFFALLIYLFLLTNWENLPVFESGRSYLTNNDDSISPAGWYYLMLAAPIFQLVLLRWIWRWLIWLYSIIKIAKFKLIVDPLHADLMAGLEYLNLCPLTFSFILIAPSAILSSVIGIEIIYHGAAITDYIVQIAAYVLLLPILLYMPLIVFLPKLTAVKREGIIKFGNLIRKHNKDFAAKWFGDKSPKDEEILGSVDNSSLADINGSYNSIQSIKPIPIDFKMILPSVALNMLPYIPLIFTHYSVSELFKTLLNNVLGP